jgi:hypothetical protein
MYEAICIHKPCFHSQRLSTFGEQLIPTDFPSPGADARSAKKAKIKYFDIH